MIYESTPLSINTFLVSSNHSLKRICYQVSWDHFALVCNSYQPWMALNNLILSVLHDIDFDINIPE